MKLAELYEGIEYAVHPSNPVTSERYSEPCRARFLRFATKTTGQGRHQRKETRCVFVLLDEPSREQFSASWRDLVKGSELVIPSRFVWRTWKDQQERHREQAARTAARDMNIAIVREALGRLGLHDQRFMQPRPLLEEFEVTVSAAELTKVANAVVEIEQLLLNWYREGVEGHESMLAAEALHLWCEGHDFGNVTG